MEELERQCLEIERQLQEQRSAQSTAQIRWEGEALAWQALCADAKEAARALSDEASVSEEQRIALERETCLLRASLEDTEAEVARLHAVQSTLEARRLHTAQRAAEEIHELEQAAAGELPKVARPSRDLSEELVAAKQQVQTLRLECAAERELCREAVARLAATERRRQLTRLHGDFRLWHP
eukprot:gb/GFBE01051113.1/.p1 GENE.gb/GFBE01051113.1/~~gb/GFBE01051113.1/.p1  ORF type:complete len:182 (+),score=37.14 gb/GFBE01051113.1/:1-546(+)